MTYAPASVKSFMSVWTANGGVNSGIVGDAAHAARPSYHNGWDRAVARHSTTSMAAIASMDYTFRLPRDQVKSNAAMAADLGKLNGTLKGLYSFSQWLVDQCVAKKPGHTNIREIIYSPDGKYVKRWSHSNGKVYTSLRKNSDGSITTITPGQGDSSHYWHTHISFYRDSEAADLAAFIRPYFAKEEDMPALTAYTPGHVATIRATSNIRSAPTITAGNIVRVAAAAGEQWTVVGWVKGSVDPDGGSDQWVCRWANGRWEYTAKSNITSGPTAPVTGLTESQVAARVAAATAPYAEQVSQLKRDVADAANAERERIAAAEAARISKV
jgi:hypothetical protein